MSNRGTYYSGVPKFTLVFYVFCRLLSFCPQLMIIPLLSIISPFSHEKSDHTTKLLTIQ